MNEWPFDDARNTASITTRQVLEAGAPVLHVSHDADDGRWQFSAARRIIQPMRGWWVSDA